MAGFGNEQGSLSYLPGAIHSVRDFYSTFEGDVRQMGPFILGTSRSSGGDSGKNDNLFDQYDYISVLYCTCLSNKFDLIKNKLLGGGIWGSRGLIGMNVACTTMPLKFHHLAISEAAIFSAKNIISPAFRFKDAYMVCFI